jgi:DegV family protein with EDD domain
MGKVVIMTDSTACVPEEDVRRYGIRVVPAAIILFDGKEYVENETISASEAYDLIRKDPDKFSTSAMTPGHLLDALRGVAETAEAILHVTISSELSANYRTASMAAETLAKEKPRVKARILDSRTVAGAEALIVLSAARAASQGKSLDEVAAVAEKARENAKGFMLLDTLRYIYRTGRMSKLSSRIASIFNIKPINRLKPDGSIEFVDKVRKREDGFKRLLELIGQEAGTDRLHFVVSHADAPEIAQRFAELLRERYHCLSLRVSDYSPVMGYGAGPACLFVGFHPESEWLGAQG